jgi:predicted O-linked N-acetylglucosamine transferase (SPINDLY family)
MLNNEKFSEVTNFLKQSKFQIALDALKIIETKYRNYYYFYLLGLTYEGLNQSKKAIESLESSIKLNNKFIDSYFNLGIIYFKLRNLREAEKNFNLSLNLNPNDHLVLFNLGLTNFEKKKFTVALDLFKKSFKINSFFFEAVHYIGFCYEKLNNFKKATEYYNKSIELDKNFNFSFNNLGNILLKKNDFKHALDLFNKALVLRGDKSLVYNNLASLYFALGDAQSGVNYMEQAVLRNERNYIFLTRLISSLCYLTDKIKDYEKWQAKYKDLISLSSNSISQVDKKKILKIGFVSSDFVEHPISFFLLDLLPLFKKNNIFIAAYSNSESQDKYTEKLKSYFTKWTDIFNLQDDEVAMLIKNDQIKLLIDLGGHTHNNRLNIFLKRPAQFQISWAGYLASTGNPGIDFIIADKHVVNEKSSEIFQEKILKLENIWCHFSSSDIKEIYPENTPALINKFITFGSFNNLNKINENVIKVWSSILAKVEKSKLFIKTSQLKHDIAKIALIKRFEKFNIGLDRLILEESSPRLDLLKSYNRIDIALDTFPYSGGTTSFETSWMCVPLLTLQGSRFISNCGVSINKNLKMDDWIANNEFEYINKAINFSKNIDQLDKIRFYLRNNSRKSILFDSETFYRDFMNSVSKVIN